MPASKPLGAPIPEIWTTRRLIVWTTEHLGSKGVENPRLVAETLLAHILSIDRIKLYMDMDRPASELERGAYRDLVERAAGHEPVDYLVGKSPFFSMWLKVTPEVLVPRPSTETLVEHVVQHSKQVPGFKSPTIADVGTGSGAIAIALAKHIPGARVVATDISAKALEVARFNAEKQGVDGRVEFEQGDLLEPLGGRRFHYLVSNPPYISDREWVDVPANVKDYEPVIALRGGVDGLDAVRVLIRDGGGHLVSPGQLVLEIAGSQKRGVLDLVEQTPRLKNARILADHQGLDRVLVADFD